MNRKYALNPLQEEITRLLGLQNDKRREEFEAQLEDEG